MTDLPEAFEIPEATHELAVWLEERLCDERLFKVVEALSAVRSVAGENKQADDDGSVLAVSDEKLKLVLNEGLSCLSRQEINHLLSHPRELCSLQEEVFKNGGEYWTQYFDQTKAAGTTQLPSMQNALREQGTSVPMGAERLAGKAPAFDTRKRSFLPIAILSALAASVLFFAGGFWLGQNQPRSSVAERNGVGATPPPTPVTASVSQPWGWNRPNALQVELDRGNKLNHVANLLSEWNAYEPESASELLVRAQDLRDSCDVLLESKFTDLPEDDIDWLKQKCQSWASKFDTQIARLTESTNFESVRDELNRLVRKSIFLIRAKARDV